jgi:hypothetical protein
MAIRNLIANGAEKIHCQVGMQPSDVFDNGATALKASSPCTFQQRGAFFAPLKKKN